MQQARTGLTGPDSVQPESGWWFFEKEELSEEEELARLSDPNRGGASAEEGMDHVIDVWAAELRPPPEQIFEGGGRRLGIASTQPATVTPSPAEPITKPDAPEIDVSKLTILIRIRLCDSSSLTLNFSPEQTIDDIYCFVSASNAASQERKWVFMSTFPSKKLDEREVPLGDVEELKKRASMVQKWVS